VHGPPGQSRRRPPAPPDRSLGADPAVRLGVASIRSGVRFGVRAGLGLVASAALLTACDGGGSPPVPSTTHLHTGLGTAVTSATSRPGGAEVNTSAAQDKCRIVAATAIHAVVRGKLVAETAGFSGVGNPVCTFQFTGTATHQDLRVALSANQAGRRASFRSTKSRTAGAQTIQGLADDAFFVPSSSTLEFIKNSKVVIVQTTVRRAGSVGAAKKVGRDLLVKLARAVLAQ
jgi:hypothetical protein